MKKMMIHVFLSMALVGVGAAPVFAVWPPSTSLENEVPSEPIDNIDTGKMPVRERLHSVVRKIEQDERRLAIVLSNLKKDEEALNKLLENPEAQQSLLLQDDSQKRN